MTQFIAVAIFSLLLVSCAAPMSQQPLPLQAVPLASGSYYHVQPGETLWRIAHDFGIDVQELAVANRLPDPTKVKPGQRLFLPAPPTSNRFLWPARGRLTQRGQPAVRSISPGLEIEAREGSFVRASRSGRVAVASARLAGWGPTVLLDHGDGYVTVYAGLDQLLVTPGIAVAQGNPVGRLGQQPLYFEIRYRTRPRDPLRFLP